MRKPAAVASYLGKPLSYIDVNGPSWSFAYEAEVNKLSRLTKVQSKRQSNSIFPVARPGD